MTLPLFFFYLFAAVAVVSAFMVISARNPVHAVLFLILTFVNGAGLFMLAGAEFLALMQPRAKTKIWGNDELLPSGAPARAAAAAATAPASAGRKRAAR